MPLAPNFTSGRFLGCILAMSISALAGSVAASPSEKVLYSFKGGSDGIAPYGALITDSAGNLYGTTADGGGGAGCPEGCGTVFQLAPDGTEAVLYAFKGGSDGIFPEGSLMVDSAGNYYGTTVLGGASDAGTSFKLAPDGTETVLYAFTGGSDGAFPGGGLAADAKGNFYGATEFGGDMAGCGGGGCGVVFEIDSSGHESVLHAFTGGSDGLEPSGGVIRDGNGNLYGTTAGGGGQVADCPLGCGTVFRIAPDGTESVLYAFQGGGDGESPVSGLIADKAGNLYGTTQGGGGAPCNCGTVFKLTPDGTETVPHAFQDGCDGANPEAGLIVDKSGNFYGTTFAGGGTHCRGAGRGTVFKLAPDGTETVLYAFYRRHGKNPTAALLEGANGILYGTATAGGTNKDGVVFRVKQ